MVVRCALLSATLALIVSWSPVVQTGPEPALAQSHNEQAAMMASANLSVVLAEYSITPSVARAPANQPVSISTMNIGTSNAGHQLSIAGFGEEWTSDLTRNGESAEITVTFPQPGVYWIWCPVGSHKDRGMMGAITVE